MPAPFTMLPELAAWSLWLRGALTAGWVCLVIVAAWVVTRRESILDEIIATVRWHALMCHSALCWRDAQSEEHNHVWVAAELGEPPLAVKLGLL